MEQAWAALEEDLGPGDLSAACLNPDAVVDWEIEAQADGVLCGCGIAAYLLADEENDPDDCFVDIKFEDSEPVHPGDIVLKGRSLSTKLLARERTALNFLMLLSGTATLTRKFVERLEGSGVDVTDTRKTVPGLRSLQKYAVRCGGGKNHRLGLFDGVMVKDNHIQAAGSISEAVARARHSTGHMTKIEVECETVEQVDEAVRCGADVVMLDNMDPFAMAEAAKKYGRQVVLEASGGVSLETVRGVAASGIHVVSVGGLTHSAPALPFHLEVRT
ncbi:MAG: carboxylating nicotinate-nucleotide diphosphorylase [Armatimonadetes bacterium]|nr:carboxylating nicotinate-nucleotide diphosphorylase [Armatimonadota bacterium]